MTWIEIVKRWESPDTECIYGRMYGHEYRNENERDKIIRIEKNEIEKFDAYKEGIVYVWGWPGPDYNVYWFRDYGKTWAFDRDELEGEDA